MSVFEELGVPTIINAKGPATRVSGGIMRPEPTLICATCLGNGKCFICFGSGKMACPFCQSLNVQVLGSSGVNGALTMLRCDACAKEWSEMLATSSVVRSSDSEARKRTD